MIWFSSHPLQDTRWVSIDCETSGLDGARDRLLSVGAVAIRDGRIVVNEAFHAYVRQDEPSPHDNILVHGIGGDAQLAGQPASEVIRELQGFAADALPVGFHAPFDAAVLKRYGFRAARSWLDLAQVAPALFPGRRLAERLEDWLAAFHIEPLGRHSALGDAFSTAQLFLVVLAEARRQGVTTAESLMKLQRALRWLRPA